MIIRNWEDNDHPQVRNYPSLGDCTNLSLYLCVDQDQPTFWKEEIYLLWPTLKSRLWNHAAVCEQYILIQEQIYNIRKFPDKIILMLKIFFISLTNINYVSLNLSSTDSEQLSQLRVSKKTLQGGDGLENQGKMWEMKLVRAFTW